MKLEWEHLWLVSLWRLLLYWHVLASIKIKKEESVVVAAAAVLADMGAFVGAMTPEELAGWMGKIIA